MMQKIRKLFQDNREIVMYLIFGVLTTAVNWAVYMLFDKVTGLSALPAESARYTLLANVGQAIAWVAAVLFAFFTNKKFVFESTATAKTGGIREFFQFVLARVASLLLFELGLFNLLLPVIKNDKWDKLIITVVVIIFNYVASKWVVFRKRDK